MIIGLTGLKQSGKSTVAEYLEKEYKFQRHNFKDALVKEMTERMPDVLKVLSTVDGSYKPYLSDEEKVRRLFDTKPPLMRALMQNYGTELRRGDDPDYWVKLWRKSVPEGRVVVDDVRFMNEADAVKLAGGVIIRIVRDDIEPTDTHQSETEQTDIEADFTIIASKGDHEGAYKQVESILHDMSAD